MIKKEDDYIDNIDDIDDNENINVVYEYLLKSDKEKTINEIYNSVFIGYNTLRKVIFSLFNGGLLLKKEKSYIINKNLTMNQKIYAIEIGVDVKTIEKYHSVRLLDNNNFLNQISNGDYDYFKSYQQERKKNKKIEFLKRKIVDDFIFKELHFMYDKNNELISIYEKENNKKNNIKLSILKGYNQSIKNTLDIYTEKYINENMDK